MSNRPQFVYVIHIASTPEKVWQALTEPGITEQYWFGFRVAANGKVGEHMTAWDPAGKEVHHDVILESDPPRRLSYAWRPLYDDVKHERPSRVTIDIAQLKDQVRVTIMHEISTSAASCFRKSARAGRRCSPVSRASLRQDGLRALLGRISVPCRDCDTQSA